MEAFDRQVGDIRQPIGKNAKTRSYGTTRRNCIDWKAPGTPILKLSLCVLLVLVMRVSYKLDATLENAFKVAKHRPKKVTDWRKILRLLHRCIPELDSHVWRRHGKELTTVLIKGRFHNMFNIWSVKKKKAVWGMNDSENPFRNRKLRNYMEEAIERVEKVLG